MTREIEYLTINSDGKVIGTAEEAFVDDINMLKLGFIQRNLLKEAAQAKPRDGLKLAFHPKDTRDSVEIQHAAFA